MAKNGTGKTAAPKAAKMKGLARKISSIVDEPKVVKTGTQSEARLAFVAKYGEKIVEAWKAAGDKATSMGTWRSVFPKAEQPCRLVDYALVYLGLRKTEDKGLLGWLKADQAESKAKAKKA